MNTVKRFKKTFAVTLSVMIVIVASTSVIFADDTINNGVTPTPPIESGVLEDEDVVFCAEIGDPEDFPLEETELANNMTLPEGIIVVGDDVNGNQRPTSVWNVAKKGKYNILLCHSPIDICTKEYLENSNIDLVLCGHMHGGVLPNFLRKVVKNGGIITPERKPFPKNCYGYIKVCNTEVIISSGITVIRPLRNLFVSEIVKIK